MINKFLIVLIPTLVLIFSFVCCASSSSLGQETYGKEMQFMEKNYVQTFYDDFSGTKLDTKNGKNVLNGNAKMLVAIGKMIVHI